MLGHRSSPAEFRLSREAPRRLFVDRPGSETLLDVRQPVLRIHLQTQTGKSQRGAILRALNWNFPGLGFVPTPRR